MEEIDLGSSQDYFDSENSFKLKGYFSLPQNASTLVVFQSDIFGSGNDAFAQNLAKSLSAKGIGLLSFDNSGSESFGGKSSGEVRDYLPEQMIKDIVCVLNFVESDERFGKLKIVLAGYSYGAVPATLALADGYEQFDGFLIISPPEKGMEIYEKLYKDKFVEMKNELGEKVWNIKDASGKELKLSGLFFSEKRMAFNILPIMEVVYRMILASFPVRIIFGGADEILKIDNVNNKEPFVIIDEARHDFSNKWDELISKIETFCSGL